jgi:adenosylcobinamide-phosphate synthase
MIIESILVVAFALSIDFVVGDPKNRFHPTVWIGQLIGKLVPIAKNDSDKIEKFAGAIIVLVVSGIVTVILVLLQIGLELITVDIFSLIAVVVIGGILLKTTIAIRGMEKHAISVVQSLENNDIDSARDNLSMIVKRSTKNLDKNHILSGVMESVSENTVDGITGPLFYFAIFGLPGAFVYRVINTFDSMIGYKSDMFKNLGWFGANCDKILNYIPARITGLIMILSSAMLGYNWKSSYQIMKRDGTKLESPNAGYPMAALAGAIGTKLEKIDHYSIGNGELELTKQHIHSAIALMKVTSILFCGIVTIPIIIVLSYLGWWLHA